MDIFTVLIYQPIYNLVVVLYNLFGGDLGLAIITIALLSRIITIPVTMRQIKMSEQSRELNAKIKAIKEKYKNNKEKQNQEMMKVQSEYLPGQIAGCLPIIVQFVILINIYSVINDLFHNFPAGFNHVAYGFVPQFAADATINGMFLGLDLKTVPGNIINNGVLAVLPFLVLSALVALTQYFSGKVLMGINTPDKKEEEAKKAKQKKGKKDESAPDFAEIMQQSTKQTMFILPLLLLFTSLNFPAGLSLYWTVQNGFVIIQQLVTKKLRQRNVKTN